MNYRIIFYFIIVIFNVYSLWSQNQTFTLNGKVIDAKSRIGLPYVTIRILETTKGTISDENGNYLINLGTGNYKIQVSCVGYEEENIDVHLNGNLVKNIELKESFIQLHEVMIIAEDPGIGIIRKAIANKKKWIEKLNTYKVTAYTKQTLFKGDSIASITESYSNGFWHKKDGFREKVFQKRQTENIKLNENFAQLGGILNFNNDEIIMAGYTFIGPTAPDALEEYDYKLLKTYESRGFNIYELKIIPKSKYKPLFEGTICISDSVFAITKVEVTPNSVFKIPFVKDISMKYSQRFNVFDTIFWMPIDISVDAKLSIKVPGLKMPSIGVRQRSILYDYQINLSIPDSIFKVKGTRVDTAVRKFDTVYWNNNRVLPLTSIEEKIYRTLDSTQTLDKQFKPEGPLTMLDNNSFSAISFLNYTDFRFNRVEGYFLGGKYSFDTLFTKYFGLSFGLGYGFSDKKIKNSLALNLLLSKDSKTRFGLNIYNNINNVNEDNYPIILNTFTSIFDKADYWDYYMTKGYSFSFNSKPLSSLGFGIKYTNEKQTSTESMANHGLFSKNNFRINPKINEGRFTSLAFEFDLYKSIFNLEREFISVQIGPEKPILKIGAEVSKGFLGSDFNYISFFLNTEYKFTTFYKNLLLPPYIDINLSGGFSSGELPFQKKYVLDSKLTYYAPSGVFKSLDPQQLRGDAYFALHIEHNFRTIPFQFLNLSAIEDEGIEFITFATIGNIWNKNTFPITKFISDRGVVSEVGFGFSKILFFLRTDFTWKITPKTGKAFFFTLQFGNIL